ncbi:MAG: nitrate reductase NapD [Gammaproteobacteria bacterium]|jgi:nitrate reductase NapD
MKSPSPNTTTEYHVASFVAQVLNADLDDVKQAIEQIIGAEIHAVSAQGKIVFTLEDSSQQGIGQNIDKLKYQRGLLNLAPVYHEFMTENKPETQHRNKL